MSQSYTKKDTIKSLRRIDLEFLPRDNTLYSTLSHLTRSPIFGVEGKQAIFFPKQETYTPLMKHSAT